MKEKNIKVLVVKPNCLPYGSEIKNELKTMQHIVGGYIEAVHIDRDIVLICNEEGKILYLQPNRVLRNEWGEAVDIICGTFFICRQEGEEFSSLSDEEISTYYEIFKNYERGTN